MNNNNNKPYYKIACQIVLLRQNRCIHSLIAFNFDAAQHNHSFNNQRFRLI